MKQIREINLSSVLVNLHQNGPLSRAQLAAITDLNKSTISSLVEDLIDRDLVVEYGIDASGIGRPATLLNLNPRAGSIIGVEIGVDFISVILTSLTGQILWQHCDDFDSKYRQVETISRVFQIIDEACEVAQERGERLLGMGLALPGMVNVEEGILAFSPNLQWSDVTLGEIFTKYTGLPVFIDNDANAAAMGEHLFGVARQAKHFLFIIDGVGVGGGLFLNGDLYRGANGLAGEIGHTSMYVEQASPCRCGNNGCWENLANQSSLYERIRRRLEVGRTSSIRGILANRNSPLTLSIITQAAKAGDYEALEALRETGSALGMGVANLINIFNPEMVVIGGSMSAASEFIIPSVQMIVEKRSLANIRKHTQILGSAFGTDASVVGAAALVVQAIYLNPYSVNPVHEFLPISNGGGNGVK